MQITLKNAHGKKKTNVEKQTTCFKRWILMMIALSNDDSNDECIRIECIPAKRSKLLSSYTPSLYKRKHGDGHCFARYFSKQFKPNEAGLFDGSFFSGRGEFVVNLTPLDKSGKTDLISI